MLLTAEQGPAVCTRELTQVGVALEVMLHLPGVRAGETERATMPSARVAGYTLAGTGVVPVDNWSFLVLNVLLALLVDVHANVILETRDTAAFETALIPATHDNAWELRNLVSVGFIKLTRDIDLVSPECY